MLQRQVINRTLLRANNSMVPNASTTPFSGTLGSTLNADTTFSEITTGTAYEISEITAVDGAVVTFAGGGELVTNGGIESTIPTMNGVSLSYFRATGAQDAGQAHGGSNSLKVTSTGVFSSARFLDGSNCGLVSGTWYKISCWVYIPSGQTCYGATMTYRIAGDSTETILDSVSTTTDAWVNLVGYYQGFDPERVIQVIGNDIVATEFFYIDDISIKPLHSFDANDVIVIGGVDSAEGVGAEENSGTLTIGNWYIITATDSDHFYVGDEVDDIFQATAETALDASNKVKLIIPTQAKSYRITSIDANGVCTLDADFSDMAAAITGGYTSEASFTNYTAGDGWMPGTDVDPTPIATGTLTEGEVYFVTALADAGTFGEGVLLYDFFTSAGDETADATNTVLHITDTYATCDGTNSSATELYSTEFNTVNRDGYNIETVVDSMDGAITAFCGNTLGPNMTIADTYTHKIKNVGISDNAGLVANAAVTSAKITSLTIKKYGG